MTDKHINRADMDEDTPLLISEPAPRLRPEPTQESAPPQEPGTQINADLAPENNRPLNPHNNLRQFVVEEESTLWLMRRNVLFKTNLFMLTSIAYTVCAVILAMQFIESRNTLMLVYICYVDILLNIFSAAMALILPESHMVTSKTRVIVAETLSVTCKSAIAITLHLICIKGIASWSFTIVMVSYTVMFVVHYFTGYNRSYDSLLDSDGNILQAMTLVLIVAKISPGSTMTWATVFVVTKIIGYLFFCGMVIVAFVFICVMAGLAILNTFSIVLLALAVPLLSKISEALLLIGLVQLATPKESVWVGDIAILVLINGISSVASYIFGIFIFQRIYLAELFSKADNKISQVPVVGQHLSLARISPTYYTIDNSQVADEESKKVSDDENAECVICCTNLSNCIILDCHHGGVCSVCAPETLKKDPNCMICRKPIVKISVVEKESRNRYKVIQDIFIQN